MVQIYTRRAWKGLFYNVPRETCPRNSAKWNNAHTKIPEEFKTDIETRQDNTITNRCNLSKKPKA